MDQIKRYGLSKIAKERRKEMAILAAVGMIANLAAVRLIPNRRLDWMNYMAAGMCLACIIMIFMRSGNT